MVIHPDVSFQMYHFLNCNECIFFRHSVVTISRVPQALFGRGRRESIAAFPALSRRRDSGTLVGPGAKKCKMHSEFLELFSHTYES